MKHYIERTQEDPKLKYPRLMENRHHPGVIVRFIRPNVGTVICSGEHFFPLFSYKDTWEMEKSFLPFHGKVIFES